MRRHSLPKTHFDMADNYIEKRMAEIASGGAGQQASVRSLGFDALVARSASDAQFDENYRVHRLQLAAIVQTVRRMIPAGVEISMLEQEGIIRIHACSQQNAPSQQNASSQQNACSQQNASSLQNDIKQSPASITPELLIQIGRAAQTAILKANDMGLVARLEMGNSALCEAVVRIGRKK